MTNPSDFGPEAKVGYAAHARLPHTSEAVLNLDDDGAGSMHDQGETLEARLGAARPRLYAVALRMMRNPDDAEDVVQDAMLKAWRNFSRFEGRAAFSTWLHRIVVNAALDRLRSRRPGEVSSSSGGGAHADEDDQRPIEVASPETPEALVEGAEIGVEVQHALRALSPVHREALALREFDGESYEDIARIVKCPIGTVMSRLHHARHRLAEEITEHHRDLLPQAA